MAIGIGDFTASAVSGRVVVDGEKLVSGHQCFLGRAISVLKGERQKENKAVYKQFAAALSAQYGAMGNDVLSSLKPNARSRLSTATIQQVVADVVALKSAYDDLKIPYNEKTRIGGCLDAHLVGSMKKFGSGNFNPVFLGEYSRPDGSKFRGIFKKEKMPCEHIDQQQWVAKHTGIDKQNPQFGMRNIATYQLNRLLGLDVIPPTEFGFHDGELGIVMGLAPGTAPKRENYEFEITPKIGHEYLARLAADKEEWSKADDRKLKQLAEQNGLKELWVDDGHLMALGNVDIEINFDDPTLLEGLNNLNWFDAFCGQGDRHNQNYVLERSSKGKITHVYGIDNDQSFGKALHDPNGIQQKGSVECRGFRGCSMPDVIGWKTAEAFLKLTPETLGKALSGLLTEEEIDACQDRLAAIQERIGVLRDEKKIMGHGPWSAKDNKLANYLTNTDSSYAARDKGKSHALQLAYDDVARKK